MKKIIFTLSLMMLFTISVKAQSNLEFNRVVKEKYSYNSTAQLNITYTVPAGKVQKITSASITPFTCSWVAIDGQIVVYNNTNSNASSIFNMTPLPLWLPAGTYAIINLGATGGGTFSFSGIEFNIVP
jgi:hypothetical protein